jgi:succinate-acetate transporter protein
MKQYMSLYGGNQQPTASIVITKDDEKLAWWVVSFFAAFFGFVVSIMYLELYVRTNEKRKEALGFAAFVLVFLLLSTIRAGYKGVRRYLLYV